MKSGFPVKTHGEETVVNVLISSAGRRTGLVEAFRGVAVEMGGKVIASDVDGLAAALYKADVAIRVPPVEDPSFLPTLRKVVHDHNVALVVPTIDTELPILARWAVALEGEGIRVAVSTLEFVETMVDKYRASGFFLETGIATPETWLPGDLPNNLPDRLFVKPRFGSASKFCFSTSPTDLHHVLAVVPDPLVQPELSGQEISVDALFDFAGTLVHCVPRSRARTVGGESVQGETLPFDDLAPWLTTVLRTVGSAGARGPVTVQAFLTAQGPMLTDLNPRFGGGVPLTFAAGGHYPRWLMQMAAGERVPARLGEYTEGLVMTRALAETFTTEPHW